MEKVLREQIIVIKSLTEQIKDQRARYRKAQEEKGEAELRDLCVLLGHGPYESKTAELKDAIEFIEGQILRFCKNDTTFQIAFTSKRVYAIFDFGGESDLGFPHWPTKWNNSEELFITKSVENIYNGFSAKNKDISCNLDDENTLEFTF